MWACSKEAGAFSKPPARAQAIGPLESDRYRTEVLATCWIRMASCAMRGGRRPHYTPCLTRITAKHLMKTCPNLNCCPLPPLLSSRLPRSGVPSSVPFFRDPERFQWFWFRNPQVRGGISSPMQAGNLGAILGTMNEPVFERPSIDGFRYVAIDNDFHTELSVLVSAIIITKGLAFHADWTNPPESVRETQHAWPLHACAPFAGL
jgi:hypothetical protein